MDGVWRYVVCGGVRLFGEEGKLLEYSRDLFEQTLDKFYEEGLIAKIQNDYISEEKIMTSREKKNR